MHRASLPSLPASPSRSGPRGAAPPPQLSRGRGARTGATGGARWAAAAPAQRRARREERRRPVQCPSPRRGYGRPARGAAARPPGVRARPGDAADGSGQCPGGGVPQPELPQVPGAEPRRGPPRGRDGRKARAGARRGRGRGSPSRPRSSPLRRAPALPGPPCQRRARGACAALRRAAAGTVCKVRLARRPAPGRRRRDGTGCPQRPGCRGRRRVPVREPPLLRPSRAPASRLSATLRRGEDGAAAVPGPAPPPGGGGAAWSSTRGRAEAAPGPAQRRGPGLSGWFSETTRYHGPFPPPRAVPAPVPGRGAPFTRRIPSPAGAPESPPQPPHSPPPPAPLCPALPDRQVGLRHGAHAPAAAGP